MSRRPDLLLKACDSIDDPGISGSVTIGDFAVLAGQVGSADHVTIGEGAVLGTH